MTKNNSVHEMVDALKKLGPMTETEVFKAAFGYDRNNSMQSNKKYADMIRRGMRKGLISRVETKGLGRARFIYYAPRVVEVSCSKELDNSWYNESI
jgi:hypothetical protein|tara:strand:- start:38 stop:325 length:288 start_codon:yes stop_codon:yes gene_type:complete